MGEFGRSSCLKIFTIESEHSRYTCDNIRDLEHTYDIQYCDNSQNRAIFSVLVERKNCMNPGQSRKPCHFDGLVRNQLSC